MRNVQAGSRSIEAPGLLPHGGAIEWEELPSLAAAVAARRLRLALRSADERAAAFSSAPVWDATRPAALEPALSSEPFHEPLHGLAMREVVEPDVFRHFFGNASEGR